jgi:hypothetical protein
LEEAAIKKIKEMVGFDDDNAELNRYPAEK